jgi:hypothetical protein
VSRWWIFLRLDCKYHRKYCFIAELKVLSKAWRGDSSILVKDKAFTAGTNHEKLDFGSVN